MREVAFDAASLHFSTLPFNPCIIFAGFDAEYKQR